MTSRDYAYLFGLSALWGTSYLFIKVADDGQIAPLEMVFVRLLLAAAALALVARLQGQRLPREHRTWRALALMGLIGSAAPFFLIGWGETQMTSSLAAILNATVPIGTVLLAQWTGEERLSVTRALGIAIGFIGVVVLVGTTPLGTHPGALLGVLALLGASACYGLSATFARRALIGVPPETAAMGQMAFGAVFLALPGGVALTTTPLVLAVGPWLAVLALTLLGTVAAYLLYYRLIARVGATRTTMTTYLLPLFALIYGAIFLHEPISGRLLGGFALILLGVLAVNGRRTAVHTTPIVRLAQQR